jgi:Holliday junction resolvase RusA-like endonuclease
MLVIDLPRPPSVNNLFLNKGRGGGRVKTRAYREWVSLAAWEIKIAARSGRIEGKFGVLIILGACPGNAPDLDNMIKPIVDALVSAGVTPDDRELFGVLAVKSGQGVFIASPGSVRVEAMTDGEFFGRFAGASSVAPAEARL